MPTHALRSLSIPALCLAAACGGSQSDSTATTTSDPIAQPEPAAEPAPAEPKETADVEPIPERMHSLTPHLVVPDVKKAVGFYEEALGAEEVMMMNGPDGAPMHAEIRLGDSIVMLSPESEKWGTMGPDKAGGTCGGLMVYVEDVDARFERATEAGAEEVMPVADMFWGDRYGQVEDPYGHRWSIATHQYDVPDEEMEERAKAWGEAMAAGEKPPEFEPGEEADSHQPEGFFTVTPSLVVSGPDVIAYYEEAFGAERENAMTTPDGKLMHAEVKIGDSILMLTGEHPEQDEHMRAPDNLEGVPFNLMLYVEDADATFDRAVEAGGKAKMPVSEMFWGDRMGEVVDPSGHGWALGTHVADLTPEQMQQRMREQMAEQQAGAAEGEGKEEAAEGETGGEAEKSE